MMGNVWSDPQTHYRWFYVSNCVQGSQSNLVLNVTGCEKILAEIPQCLDAVQLAYEQPTEKYKLDAQAICEEAQSWNYANGKDRYDTRQNCSQGLSCFPQFDWLNHIMAGKSLRQAIGVPDDLKFDYLGEQKIGSMFERTADRVHPAYLLLGPSIDDGLRVLVYNGMADAVDPWRSSLAWMKLLNTQHQAAFRAAEEFEYPGVGYIRQAGDGAGDFTLFKIREAGHMAVRAQPKILRDMMVHWIKNEPWV